MTKSAPNSAHSTSKLIRDASPTRSVFYRRVTCTAQYSLQCTDLQSDPKSEAIRLTAHVIKTPKRISMIFWHTLTTICSEDMGNL